MASVLVKRSIECDYEYICFQKPLSDSSSKDPETSNIESVRMSADTCLHCNVTKLSKQDV